MSRVIVSAIVAIVFQAILITAKRPDFIDDDMMAMIKDDKDECMKEFGTTEEMINSAADGNLVNDRHITCYMSCLMLRLGLMDEGGNIDNDMMLGILPDEYQEEAEVVLNKCGHLVGADNCEKIYNGAKCLYDTKPEIWFMV